MRGKWNQNSKTGGCLKAGMSETAKPFWNTSHVKWNGALNLKKKKSQKTHHVDLSCLSVAVPLDKCCKSLCLFFQLISEALSRLLVSRPFQLSPQARHAEPHSLYCFTVSLRQCFKQEHSTNSRNPLERR